MSKDCRKQKYSNYKKIEQAEKVVDGDEVYVVCSLTTRNKKENVKKKFGSWRM